jgi:arylformamidase
VRFVELNHVIRDGMPSYPGLPKPSIRPFLDHEASRSRYQDQAEFYIAHFDIVGAVGTYLDSPFHRYRDGLDLSDVPLERLAGLPGVVLRGTVAADRSVACQADGVDLEGCAVLVHTGWDRRWGSDEYWEPGPFLGPEFLTRLLEARPALVGVDFWNVDDVGDPSRPVHTGLLAQGALVVEHLCCLDELPAGGFRFYAVPLRVQGGASFPVRAFAEID